MAGGYRLGLPRATEGLAFIALVGTLAQPAAARDTRAFDIAAGRLDDAIVALGVQADVNIGLPSATAQTMPVRAVRGRLSIEEALRRLLAGTGLRAIRIDDRTYTIVADAPHPHPAPPRVVEPASGTGDDIIVTASKRDIRLADFPGTIAMLDIAAARLNDTARNNSQAIVNMDPALASTHLGPGRNKLIVRGIADSSFSGPAQAIVGQYLGDIRLNYNAPDPDLNLYDIAHVEVLEGPQGSLYGAGSLGGIVRLVPNAPDLANFHGSIAAGIGMIEGGGPSSDIAAMANVPIRPGRIGLRAVAYRTVDGGYIRDSLRNLNHTNRSKTAGGRLTIRADLGNGWMIDAGGTAQDIDNRDGQYAERGLPRYTRRSLIAQPFDNDYRLGQITVTKKWRNVTLLSATGIVDHRVDEWFDATMPSSTTAQLFHQASHITLFTNETRLSRQNRDGTGWLIGTSLITNSEKIRRNLGEAADPPRIAALRNSVTQIATYGEASLRFRRLIVTGGGRIVYSRLSGELLSKGKAGGEPNRTEVELLPTIALSWRPTAGFTAYLRYQEGFRAGGLSVAAGTTGGIVSQRFHDDTVATYEIGARWRDPASDVLSASASLSYTHWEHIQADLVNNAGLPYSANIGNGRILGFEASARWVPLRGLGIEGSLFLNDSELTSPDPGFADALHAELPNVSRLGARAAIDYSRPIFSGLRLSALASMRYFGHSRLGVGSQLDIGQGNYAETRLNARIGTDAAGISIDVTNLLNAAKNRFSLGNPFGVMNRNQITPQQPRTVRIGIDARF